MSTRAAGLDPQRGQAWALWLSTMAGTVCFAGWTSFSIIGVQIKRNLDLNDIQFRLPIGTPIPAGSLVRRPLGVWPDLYGGRIVYVGVMVSASIATFLLTFAHDDTPFLIAAPGVGIAGGRFAVGIAYVSRWFPKQKQGTAPRIFGAGNVGAAVNKFLAAVVRVTFGWKRVTVIRATALLVTAAVF